MRGTTRQQLQEFEDELERLMIKCPEVRDEAYTLLVDFKDALESGFVKFEEYQVQLNRLYEFVGSRK